MNRITIYPEHVKNRISPFLLGHFAEQFRGNIPGGIYMLKSLVRYGRDAD